MDKDYFKAIESMKVDDLLDAHNELFDEVVKKSKMPVKKINLLLEYERELTLREGA